MKPSEIAASIRHIASAIDNSKQPDRNLVVKELKKVIVAIDTRTGRMKVNELMTLLGQQDQNAEIGITMSDKHGWIEAIRGLTKAPDGTIGIDVDAYSGAHLPDEVELTKI